MISMAYAMGTGAGAQAGQSSPGGLFIPIILMFVIFYFLLIRPQQKQARQHREMIDSLKAGTRVITTGGIHGRITKVEDNLVVLEIADNVRIKVLRGNISTLLDSNPEARKNGKESKDSKDK